MYRTIGVQRQRGVGEEPMIVDYPSDVPDHCVVPPGACLTAAAKKYLDSLNCNVPRVRGYSTRGGLLGMAGLSGGLGKVCTLYQGGNQINKAMLQSSEWDACGVKRLNVPVCAPPPPPPPTAPPVRDDPPIQTFDEPSEPPPAKEEDKSMYAIGGILAVLVVGGVGYAVFKNRKKKKKR